MIQVLALLLVLVAGAHADTIHESGKQIWPQGQLVMGPLRYLTDLLPLPCQSGTLTYCEDCMQANPCVNGGTGAFAQCVNGVWTCRDSGSGTGSVTSVDCDTGLLCTPDPITTAGTAALNINGLTTETVLDDADLFPFLDTSVGTSPSAQRKVTLANLKEKINPSTTTTTTTTTTSTTTTTTSTTESTTTSTTTTTTTTTTTSTTIQPMNSADPRYFLITQYRGSGVTDTGIVDIGFPLAGGTSISNGTPTPFQDSTGAYIDIESIATTGSNANMTGPANSSARILKPQYLWVIKTDEITVLRMWFIASDSTGSLPFSSDDPTGINLMGFRFSTNASDTTWRCAHKDGTTGVYDDSGVTVASNTRYELRLDASDGTNLFYYINGTQVCGTISSNLPTNGASLFMSSGLRTLENVSKSFRFRKYQVLQN